jgi:hypothetical protein
MNIARHVLIFCLLLAVAVTVSLAKDNGETEPVRDGSSFKRAIIVNVSPVQEVAWIRAQIGKHHPGIHVRSEEQGLVPHKGRLYDVYDLETTSGKHIVMYFDIGEDK